MKFIHIADVHLGAEPDAGSSYTANRGRELWNSFEQVIRICESEKTDLLLIAGDLFHRQPLLRELKEVNYLFESLTHTKVVLIAGNHDYVKPSSFYKKFVWADNVYALMGEELQMAEFPRLRTCVYGRSYGQREITEALYEQDYPIGKQPIEILLAHGGDRNHIPMNKSQMLSLGYKYIALGHIHKPMVVEADKMYYAGALEPTDVGDTGEHGFIRGEIEQGRVRVEFVPIAERSYIHGEVMVHEKMTGHEVREKISSYIKEQGICNMYRIRLTGLRDPEIEYDLSGMDVYGNIVGIEDQTKPAYNYEVLARQNTDNLLGRFIENMQTDLEGSIRQQALAEGVSALLAAKKG